MNWFAHIATALVRGVADLSPGCREAACLQSEALDRKLPLRQRFGLRVHSCSASGAAATGSSFVSCVARLTSILMK